MEQIRLTKVLGFTVFELMVAVLVLAVLSAIAVPNFRATVQNNRLTSQANELITALQLARSEAIKIARPVSVCPSSNGTSCGGSWAQGWIVVQDNAPAGSNSVTPGLVVRVWPALTGDAFFDSNVGSNPVFVRYLPNGMVDRQAGVAYPVTLALRVPDCSRDSARNIRIGTSGLPSATRVQCD